MPYIEAVMRDLIRKGRTPESAGELNFQLTAAIITYAQKHNNYQGFNDIIGALDAAKMEFYRRWVVPYEDYKIAQNGDVYPTGG